METKHPFALELETQKVWDFGKESFVHRLPPNKADATKLKQVPNLDENITSVLKSGEPHVVWIPFTCKI